MNNILILNLGSTSFKYELFDLLNLKSLQKGNFEIKQVEFNKTQDKIDKIFRGILREIGQIDKIKKIGHRVVHGGNIFLNTKEIKEVDLNELEKINNLAPLHNPFNLAGIKSAIKYLPNVKNFAVFDTTFFQDLAKYVKVYPIPYEYYEKYGIKKFGFHGISHKYAIEKATEKLNKKINKVKIISVHLGGGCSITAFENGKAVETSMGFTPMEGLMMQTRSGDIDIGVVKEILFQNDNNIKEVYRILNQESGLKGISQKDNYLDVLEGVKNKNQKCQLAFQMFVLKIQKYIGAYLAILGKVDAIIFTGKIGAGKIETRKAILKSNLFKGIKSLVIEPWEELEIAQEIKSK